MPFSRLELLLILIIPGPEVVLFTLLFQLSLGHLGRDISLLSVESGNSLLEYVDDGSQVSDRQRGSKH